MQSEEQTKKKILLVEPDILTCVILYELLAKAGFEVIISKFDIYCRGNYEEGYKELISIKPDLLIIDIKLPELVGCLDICTKIQAELDIPVMVMSDTVVIPLKMIIMVAVNDYIDKPFSEPEFIARINNLLYHLPAAPADILTNVDAYKRVKDKPPLDVIIAKRILPQKPYKSPKKVWIKLKVTLTRTERKLLTLFLKHAGKVLTRKYILEKVWGYIPNRVNESRIVDVHVNRLRKKIEPNPQKPTIIITIRGKGYMMNPKGLPDSLISERRSKK